MPEGQGAPALRRQAAGDPVRQMMRAHGELLAGAVDEWEIAAGLEARGVTDGDARRLRQPDVFGLAAELLARAPRTVARLDGGPNRTERALLPRRTGLRHALPGAAAAVFPALRSPVLGAGLAVFVAVTAWAALRKGPLAVPRGGGAPWAYALLAYALYGPQAVTALSGRGPFDPAAQVPSFAALTLGLVPAACWAHWLAVRSRAQLAPSHSLADYADAVRPRLAVALAGHAAALAALLALLTPGGPLAGPAALGLLLFAARLLSGHGEPLPALAALRGAALAETCTLAVAPLGLPLPGTAPEALACGAAFLFLLPPTFRALSRPAPHHP
ncbi:hypothetical protein [Actinacidiphila acididurans]|uniref:Integral membrane protein n=1 Tax=Actinacidiphila acididurans TaxID=2784346 RepID=A0ABS2TXH4_9ACTN|nr:hypothetical protein [Actinacidiphila acididurans]MBM9507676.1 hypothetical protein [Actinacidiphila acididurans]